MSGANIVDAKIFTTTKGMALDIFSIQDSVGKAFDEKPALDRLAGRIRRTLSGEINVAQELDKAPLHATRTDVFTVPPRVLINNSASQTHSLVEINARDRAGLLHKVTRTLTQLGLQISSALVATYGERVVDVFYVKDTFGMQVTHEGKLDQIRKTVLEAITENDDIVEEAQSVEMAS